MEKASNLDSKMYVLDTNVLLHEPLAYLSFQEHDVVVTMTIRGLDEILKDASPEQMLQGVALPSNKKAKTESRGRLIIVNDHLFADSISGLPGNENDHRIINCAVHLQKQHSDSKVVLVTKDINMRLKAKGAGLKFVEDYRTDQLIDDIALLTSGYKKIEGDFWQHVGECETEQQGRDTYHHIAKSTISDVFYNEYIATTIKPLL